MADAKGPFGMMDAPGELRVGLIGSGFMGACHALAFRIAEGVFELPLTPRLAILADADATTARCGARRLGFERSTGDWRALIDDAQVDLVDITAPNALHKPIAIAALEAGKPVYCEKPLAATEADALEMAEAAEAAGVATMVGFNYLKNPIMALAKEIVDSGEIGEVVGFRGIHAEDYMADPLAPYTWRHAPAGGGAFCDLGSHITSLARFLVGDIVEVFGDLHTVHAQRPVAAGAAERRPVVVDDQSRVLMRFANGASGGLEANWLAHGRTMQLAFELTGTNGAMDFSQERFNELRLYTTGQAAGRSGFKTICAGPDHAPYASFCPAPGHQLGFNDLKAIEVRDLIVGLAGGAAPWPDFREAWRVQQVVDAVKRSAQTRAWARVGDS